MLQYIGVAILVFAVLGGMLFVLSLLNKRDKDAAPADAGAEDLAYLLRDWLLTKAERSFLVALDAAVSGGHGLDGVRVMCMVRIADLVFLPKGLDRSARTRQQNRINQKHVDFVLVSADELRPLVAIELDDSSHQRDDRRARDVFVDQALAAAGLPLVRVKAARGYAPGELAERLREAIGAKV